MTEANNILHFLKKSTEFLEKKGIPNPRVDAEWLLADLLGLPRIKLYAQFETPLSESQTKDYRERIVDRGKRKPVAYITGKKGFHRFDFKVNENVLIPRPETEELVDWYFKNHKDLFSEGREVRVLDLGTGSGCIAISLSRLLPSLQIWATDISSEALLLAQENHTFVPNPSNSQITFLSSDLLKGLPSDLKFDVILTNPPYIPIEEKSSMMEDVTAYEPHLALFVNDFKEFHDRLLAQCHDHLEPGGLLLIETHPGYMETLITLAQAKGFQDHKVIQDSSSKNRFLFLKKS